MDAGLLSYVNNYPIYSNNTTSESESMEEIDALSDECNIPLKESNEEKCHKKYHDIDSILENIVGTGGWGQWMILMFTFPIVMSSELPILIQMFAAYEPRHRCFVQNCDNGIENNAIQTDFIQYALPIEYGSNEIFREDENFDPCHMFEKAESNETTSNSCNANDFLNSSIVKCNGYVYDTSVFEQTLTTKFDLVCDEESKRRLLDTLMMLGLLIGSLIGGRLSDRFGRKIIMMISQLILTPVVMFGGFSPNYTTYAILRLISATCLPPMWLCCHSLILEVFGKEYRKSVGIIKGFISALAQLTLVLIIFNSRHWTYIHIWAGVACLVPFPCYYFVPESPRWLAINGKLKQAEKVLLAIAKGNKRVIDEKDRCDIRASLIVIEAQTNKTKDQEKLSPKDMFRPGHLMKTLILLLNWVTICVGSYTLLLNSTKLYGDLFLNYTLVVLVGELPGTIALLFTLKLFGRRLNLFIVQFVLGTSGVILAFLPKSNNIAITFFFLIGKCFSGAGFLLIWLISAELYPTNLRSQAVGTCSTVARVFGLAAPFVAKLSEIWKPLPMLILGIACVFVAFLSYFLPETKNIELPTTMKDAEKLKNIPAEKK